ncbi:unnamed protein product [Aureobasidium pullulans]|nr:unnamed protein product [Aureobasidium pullulans]
MHLSTFSLLALSAALANAKTDLDGCTRTDISSPAGASPSYLAGFTAPATAAASASAVVTSAEMTAAASATATPTAGASDDNSDDEDDSSDDTSDDSSDDEDPLGLAGIDAAQESTYVWRTADNPTATFNPFTASAFPSDVSTFWIPVDLGSTTSWEAAVPTILSGGYTDITIPTFTRVAANDAMVRAGVSGQSSTSSTASGSASRSASASTETSTGAAGKMGCAVGGVLAAAMGVLVVM